MTASSARLSSSIRIMSPRRMAVTRGPSSHAKGARTVAAASVSSAQAALAAFISPDVVQRQSLQWQTEGAQTRSDWPELLLK